jgi:hypothetical protein
VSRLLGARAARVCRACRVAYCRGGALMIRVVIADDEALIRDGFRMILSAQPDLEVVVTCTHVDGGRCHDDAAPRSRRVGRTLRT